MMFDTRLPGYFVPFSGSTTNQADMMDTDETNPAEADSQSPGKSFLSKYIGGLAGSGGIEDLVRGGLAGQALGTNSRALIGGLAGEFLNR